MRDVMCVDKLLLKAKERSDEMQELFAKLMRADIAIPANDPVFERVLADVLGNAELILDGLNSAVVAFKSRVKGRV